LEHVAIPYTERFFSISVLPTSREGLCMSEVYEEGHPTPIKTPGQLIAAVVVAFLVPIAFLVLVVGFVTGGLKVDRESSAMSEAAVAARLKPVGELAIGESSAAAGSRTGEEVAQSVCQACHGAGLLGAPKIGDCASWKARLSQGEKTLVLHAIKGIRTMPPKGGNPDLSDLEVTRAVVWMANQSGANFKAPPVATAPADTAQTAKTSVAAAPRSAAAAAKAGAKPDGAQVYQTVCTVCHGAGLAGAPKLGDKAAWKPRVAQGLPTLREHALKGIRAMPPKGGNLALSDAEVAAAVDYMAGQAK
jgi:cytochrome c5